MRYLVAPRDGGTIPPGPDPRRGVRRHDGIGQPTPTTATSRLMHRPPNSIAGVCRPHVCHGRLGACSASSHAPSLMAASFYPASTVMDQHHHDGGIVTAPSRQRFFKFGCLRWASPTNDFSRGSRGLPGGYSRDAVARSCRRSVRSVGRRFGPAAVRAARCFRPGVAAALGAGETSVLGASELQANSSDESIRATAANMLAPFLHSKFACVHRKLHPC